MRAVILLLVGAVVGTLLDRMHVIAGVLGYPDPGLFGQALWVPPLFAAATWSLVDGHAFAAKTMRAPRDPSTRREVALTVGLFVAAYAATAVFDASPWVTLAALTVGWVAYTAVTRRLSAGFVAYAMSTAAIGVLIESLLTRGGFFFYTRPTLMTVSIWLPALYLWAASAGAALDRHPGVGATAT